MREILFRGKSVNDGNWVQGSLVITTIELADDAPIKHYHIEDMTIGVFPNEHQSGLSETVDPNTVGQFTGLTDMNGKKIFEGDICIYPDGWVDYAGDGVETFSVGVVTWDDKNPSFYLTDNIGVEWDEIWDSADEITVIGNIHDGPELLGGADNAWE